MAGDFTVKGYNDRPKACQEQPAGRKCSGMVRPTFNANMGRCDTCGARVPWTALQYVEGVK